MLSSKRKFLQTSYKTVRLFWESNLSTVPQHIEDPPPSSPTHIRKPKRSPFMKNVFTGIFDDIVFNMPEVKTTGRSDNFQHIQKKENMENNYDSFKYLLEKGFLKLNASELDGGCNSTQSDLIRLYEELDLNPSVSALLDCQLSMVKETIVKYGSRELNEKYLSRILSGELTGAYAMSEDCGGSDPTIMDTTVQEEEDHYLLNGKKIWVTNCEQADIFIVFAKNIFDNFHPTTINPISVFLIEKSEGVTIEKHNSIGLEDCGLSKLKFDNVKVPKGNLIGDFCEGYKVAVSSLTCNKLVILTCILNSLKKLLKTSISHIHSRKQIPRDLKDCELIKHKLSNITLVTYGFESMLYLTSRLLDEFDTDTSLEFAILQLYAFEMGLGAISECMVLLGAHSYDASLPYEKLWRDLKGLTYSTKTLEVIKLYASLIGLDHAGRTHQETITKNRNPLDFPGFVFNRLLKNNRQNQDKPKLNLKLYMNLHPTLKISSDMLEYCVLRLQFAVESVLTRNGAETANRQIDLKRLSDVATEIYAMTAVLSRASRAFCTGIRHSDEEVHLAQIFCFESHARVKKNIQNILDNDSKLADVSHLNIASTLLNRKSYFFEHPLTRNIV